MNPEELFKLAFRLFLKQEDIDPLDLSHYVRFYGKPEYLITENYTMCIKTDDPIQVKYELQYCSNIVIEMCYDFHKSCVIIINEPNDVELTKLKLKVGMI